MKIFCCACQKEVNARLTDAREIYPHRLDLSNIPFWKCNGCKNYVGCHHKTKNRTHPLGNIPTKEMKSACRHIHKILDPLWKNGSFKRSYLYAYISKTLGYEYHTGELRTIESARKVYAIILNLEKASS